MGGAHAIAEAGVPVLLFDAPYNREVAHRFITRCSGWNGVLTALSAAS